MTVGSSGIRRDALVSSSMPRRHTVDAQEADPLINYDINVRSARVYRAVVERPRQIHREVAFDDRARDRQHLAGVERIVAERELEDLWRDCVSDTAAWTKGRGVRNKQSQNGFEEGRVLWMPPMRRTLHPPNGKLRSQPRIYRSERRSYERT